MHGHPGSRQSLVFESIYMLLKSGEVDKAVDYMKNGKNKLNKSATLAIQSYIDAFQKKKVEAISKINEVIKSDMKNSFIWKIQGFLFEELREYTKALQSFNQSLKINKDEPMVMDELILLNLYFGYKSQCLSLSYQMFNTNQTLSSVLLYVYCLVVNDNIDQAIKLLLSFEKNFMTYHIQDRLALTDTLRFHGFLLNRIGEYDECIKLIKESKLIKDNVSGLEIIAVSYEKLGDKVNLFDVVDKLLVEYPDNGNYFDILERNMTDEEYMTKLFDIKDKLNSKYAYVRILELLDMNDSRYEPMLRDHVQKLIHKGSPSIYTTISNLSTEKLDNLYSSLDSYDIPIYSFPVVNILKAKILERSHRYEDGLNLLEQAIKHTPTITSLYINKIGLLYKLGRNKESMEAGKILYDLDSSDRNSNNLYITTLYRAGFPKKAYDESFPFALDESQTNRLYKSGFNKMHLRAGLCNLRIGNIDNFLHYNQDVFQRFAEYKSGILYYSKSIKKIMCFYEIFDWIDSLVNHDHYSEAFKNICRVMIKRGNVSELTTYAIKVLSSSNQRTLGYMCVVFSQNNHPLSALKCYLKLKEPYIFLALPSIKMQKERISEHTELIQDIFNEYYSEFTGEPSTYEDYLCLIYGTIFAKGDAKSFVGEALKFDLTYKQALELYLIVLFDMGDKDFAESVLSDIKSRYSSYEIELTDFEEDHPHEHYVEDQ